MQPNPCCFVRNLTLWNLKGIRIETERWSIVLALGGGAPPLPLSGTCGLVSIKQFVH